MVQTIHKNVRKVMFCLFISSVMPTHTSQHPEHLALYKALDNHKVIPAKELRNILFKFSITNDLLATDVAGNPVSTEDVLMLAEKGIARYPITISGRSNAYYYYSDDVRYVPNANNTTWERVDSKISQESEQKGNIEETNKKLESLPDHINNIDAFKKFIEKQQGAIHEGPQTDGFKTLIVTFPPSKQFHKYHQVNDTVWATYEMAKKLRNEQQQAAVPPNIIPSGAQEKQKAAQQEQSRNLAASQPIAPVSPPAKRKKTVSWTEDTKISIEKRELDKSVIRADEDLAELITSQLQKIQKKMVQNNDLTALTEYIKAVNVLNDTVSQYPVMLSTPQKLIKPLEKNYTPDFAKKGISEPQKAYEKLVEFGIENAENNPRMLSTEEIRKRIAEKRSLIDNNSQKTPADIQISGALRELETILGRDIAREVYDAWIDGEPIPYITPVTQKNLMTEIAKIKNNLEETKNKKEKDDLNRKLAEGKAQEWEDIDVIQGRRGAPSSLTSRIVIVDLSSSQNGDAKQAFDIEESAEKSYFHFLQDPRFLAQMKQNPNGYTDAIKKLMVTFYGIAQQKGQGFEEGTFVIEDPQGILFTFLRQHPQANQRTSSHFADRFPKSVTAGIANTQGYGIDINFPNNSIESGYEMGHILFNQFVHKGKSYTFIKPEHWGIGYMQVPGHAWEFVTAQANKAIYPARDDAPTFRKERIPQTIKKLWENLVATSKLDKKQQEEFKIVGIENKGGSGIWKMRDLIEEHKNKFDEKTVKEFNDAIAKEQYDNLDVRKGREVIITQEDLLKISKQISKK